jgi:hypothetical protein
LRRVSAQTRSNDLFQQLNARHQRIQHETALMVDVVMQAREAGYSWTRIGEAFGVSKQAALQRFGPGGRYDVEKMAAERKKKRSSGAKKK